MKKRNLPHIIAVTGLVIFIVLGVASGGGTGGAASTPSARTDGQQVQSGTQQGLDSADAYIKRVITDINADKNYDLAIDDCRTAIPINPKGGTKYLVP
jgi:hypothetical protein